MSSWARVPEVLWRDSLASVVLLPPGATEPFSLSESGALLWDLLDRPRDTGELADALAELYQVSAQQVVDEIVPALEELQQRGAVQRMA